MIFLTVGTQFPFDRLVKAVDAAIAQNGHDERFYGQIGEGNRYTPQNMDWVSNLAKAEYDDVFRNASAIIAHAGMGTIALALRYGKPLLVMPRLKRCGEVVHDHQVDIARKFGESRHILVAYREAELADKMKQLRTFVPEPRGNQAHSVAERIATFLKDLK